MTEYDKNMLLLTPEAHDDHGHADDDFTHLGMAADVNMLSRSALDRRRILGMGALGVGTLLGASMLGQAGATILGGGGRPPMPPGGGTPPVAGQNPMDQGDADTIKSANGQCTTLPSETNGPYPADGANISGQTINILNNSGIVRSDLTRSISTGNSTSGIPLTLVMQLVNVNGNCTPLSGYVIYVWHCTADGNYSLYTKSVVNEDFLRGAQVTDAHGRVTFTTIFPGCYTGRWPHIHFEVYKNLAAATQGNVNSNVSLVSQIALPAAQCRAVYKDKRYGNSTTNLSRITLATDSVFGDGAEAQTPAISGSVETGYKVGIVVGLQN